MSGFSNMHDHIFPLNLNGGPQSALNGSFHMGDAIMNYSDYLQPVKPEQGKKIIITVIKKAPKLKTDLKLMKRNRRTARSRLFPAIENVPLMRTNVNILFVSHSLYLQHNLLKNVTI